MAVVSHERPQSHTWREQLFVPEVWAFLAIAVTWLAVLFAGVYGPDIETNTAGGDRSVVPSVVVVALFAFLATWAIAAYGFRRSRDR